MSRFRVPEAHRCQAFRTQGRRDGKIHLDMMLTSSEGLSDVELQDLCFSMMFAGHDTTLCSLQSCLYWLKQHPAQEMELRAEVQQVWDGTSEITREHLGQLPRLRAFLQEVMRMTPPIHAVSRMLSSDAEVDGYTVPKGWTVTLATTLIHSSVNEPEVFRLGRHIDASGSFIDSTYDAASFAAFGGGSRMCIGHKFAKDEMLVFMMELLRNFQVEVGSAKMHKFPFNFWQVDAAFFLDDRSMLLAR